MPTELLGRVGLEGRLQHYPKQLSGGEQQRVAIARAFATEPAILFADEPTGNLDNVTGERVIDLLFRLNRDKGTTLVLVTHDEHLAGRCERLIRLEAGRVVSRCSRRRAPIVIRWRLSMRLLARNWRSGEQRILALALVIAVAASTAIGFFTDRLGRGMVNQSADFLGADLALTQPATRGQRLARAQRWPPACRRSRPLSSPAWWLAATTCCCPV